MPKMGSSSLHSYFQCGWVLRLFGMIYFLYPCISISRNISLTVFQSLLYTWLQYKRTKQGVQICSLLLRQEDTVWGLRRRGNSGWAAPILKVCTEIFLRTERIFLRTDWWRARESVTGQPLEWDCEWCSKRYFYLDFPKHNKLVHEHDALARSERW